jgi:hypothetical protein
MVRNHASWMMELLTVYFGGFSSKKSAPAIRKTGFYANRDPNKQEVGFIFA